MVDRTLKSNYYYYCYSQAGLSSGWSLNRLSFHCSCTNYHLCFLFFLLFCLFFFRMYFDSESSSADLRYFTWLVVVAQLIGAVAVVLVGVWMGYFQGGFAWQSDPEHQFNFHPLFMIIGMVFLYADGKLQDCTLN